MRHVILRFVWIGFALASGALAVARANESARSIALSIESRDVLAFVGGQSVVRQGEEGHLESLLTAANAEKTARFRNLAWEGDTVFEQPRDLNFPGLGPQLKRVGATVIFAEFGRTECLGGKARLDAFAAAYDKLCNTLAADGRRVVLVTPAPFERPALATLPDLSKRNEDLALYVNATRELAKRRGFACADVFAELFSRPADQRLYADDALNLTPRGSALIALAIARQLKLDVNPGGEPSADGKWPAPALESVREAVVEKNRLWFDYWRPMNWAFLGGDRMFTPSSRDPDNLSVRIFPRELEKFVPLIEQADAKIDELAKAAGSGK